MTTINPMARGSLRLSFRSEVPIVVPVRRRTDGEDDDWSPAIGLYVANEFGMFSRDTYPEPARGEWSVQCFALELANSANEAQVGFPWIKHPIDVLSHEAFTPAGRTQVRVRLPRELTSPTGYHLLFAVKSTSSTSTLNILPVCTAQRVNGHTSPSSSSSSSPGSFNLGPDYVSCQRLLTLGSNSDSDDSNFMVYESAAYMGIGGKLWDSGVHLLEFLLGGEHLLPTAAPGTVVVDLGSGTGALGFGLAIRFPHVRVCCTDLPEIMPNLLATHHALGLTNASAFAYAWGDARPPQLVGREIDVLLLADVVYEQECFQPLLDSIRVLRPKQVVLAHRNRNHTEHVFFEQLMSMGPVELLRRPTTNMLFPELQRIVDSMPSSSSSHAADTAQQMGDVLILRLRPEWK